MPTPRSDDLGLFTPPATVANLALREEAVRLGHARVRRRMTFRWLAWGGVGLVASQWLAGFLGFFWPQKVGTFGKTVVAGHVDDYKVGDVVAVREGKFYLTRVPEGFLALWWKCPHLGCTVPWKGNEPVMGGPPGDGDLAFAGQGRFHCPCHLSKYNRYGQIVSGPAPRPMDRFPLRIDPDGRIVVQTGFDKAIVRKVTSAADAVAPPDVA